ncbi:hypothetical protein BDR05DRAFT_959456 [Suillus weaverae]|nr:hypothetical protein BDR05DRAFT_959456 [Suillus weaverae]
MDRSTSYDYWRQDSELYLHVKASIAEHLQTTTDYGRTSQPHQHFLHSVLENSHGDSTPVVPQNHVACDGGSTTEDQTVVHDAGILPIPTLPPVDQGIAQGDIQSGVAGWHPRRISSSYPPYAFSDHLPAHNMGFSDTNLADSWLISPMQGFQHDPRHQIQEEVCAHPRYVVGDDESDSRVGCVSTCKWNDGHGICGRAINAARIGEHMISYHFKSPMPANSRLECLWKDCELPKSVRRDTIIRHIVEKHLGLKYRCKHWVASHTGAGFCGSRKNARLH